MTYFVFTAKHHDGFCMFATESVVPGFRRVGGGARGGLGKVERVPLHYSIMDTPFRRDVLQELAAAARQRGIGVGLYYSNQDWFDPDQRFLKDHMFYDPQFNILRDAGAHARMVRRQRLQLRELCTNYGAIQQIDLDAGWPQALWPDIVSIVKEVRRLQPQVLLRERGIGPYGDFTTPEHWVPKSKDEVPRPWQAIETLGSRWAYQPNDTYKPKEWLVATLVDCCAKGGNFMPGVSPMSNGRFPPQTIERLEYVGDWLKVNGEAIYRTRPWTTFQEGVVRYTRSQDRRHVFAISLGWPGRQLVLQAVRPNEGSPITMLGVVEPLRWKLAGAAAAGVQAGALVIELPEALQPEASRPCRQAYAFKIEVNADK